RADDRAHVEGALHVVEDQTDPSLGPPPPVPVEPLQAGAVELPHLRTTSSSRYPAREPSRSVGQPCSCSQRCSESEPRCFWTTSTARPPSRSLPSQRVSRSCSSALPTRIGGLDQIRSTARSSGTSSGVTAR